MKLSLVAVAVACAYLMSSNANAQGLEKVDHEWLRAPDVVGVHTFSVHSAPRNGGAGPGWNNNNFGAYARWDNTVVGAYHNSLNRNTVYVAYLYPVTNWLDVAFGLASGYNVKPLTPLVVPSVHWRIMGNWVGRVNVVPGIGKGSATAVNFALEYRL